MTERDEDGNANIIAFQNAMPKLYAGLTLSQANALTRALNRLAAFEDLNMTPKEINQMKRGLDIAWAVGRQLITSEYSLDRAYELLGADMDGRIVVLPCRGCGETLRLTDGVDFQADSWSVRLTAHRKTGDPEKLGNRIYLNLTDAENAVKAAEYEAMR